MAGEAGGGRGSGRGGSSAYLDFSGTYIKMFSAVKYKSPRNTWNAFSLKSICGIRNSVGNKRGEGGGGAEGGGRIWHMELIKKQKVPEGVVWVCH